MLAFLVSCKASKAAILVHFACILQRMGDWQCRPSMSSLAGGVGCALPDRTCPTCRRFLSGMGAIDREFWLNGVS
jgi:hypothetical protein